MGGFKAPGHLHTIPQEKKKKVRKWMPERSDSTLGAQPRIQDSKEEGIRAEPELSVNQLKPGVPQNYEEQRGPIQTSLYIYNS